MFRFLLATFVTALVTPFYLKWASDQAEGQLRKMERAAHFTPGAESPVPPVVIASGIGLLVGAWLTGALLRLRTWQTFLSLVVGAMAGAGLYFFGATSQRR
ncbi:MAG: hypothetical protein IPK16_03545 [Anaerolineales bacterium]|nr:hypothetical protein [Anaerolineales bacterium]